jgi:LysM repeat protein
MMPLLSRVFHAVRLVAVVVGTPLALILTVGWCLPTKVSLTDVQNAWAMGDLSSATIVKALACAVWVAWALIVLSLALHVVARVRATTVSRPSFVPKRLFAMTGRWIGGLTLAATTTVMSLASPAGATSVRPLSSITSQVGAYRSAGSAVVLDVQTATPGAQQTWHVKQGDTLWEIAEATLGDGSLWRIIVEANPSIAANRDNLDPGTQLIIPSNQAAPAIATRSALRSTFDITNNESASVLSLLPPMVDSTGADTSPTRLDVEHNDVEYNIDDAAEQTELESFRERVVVRGDTLSEIAEDEYGSAAKWKTIAADNPTVIEDPDLIFPGEQLNIRTNEEQAPQTDASASEGKTKVDTKNDAKNERAAAEATEIEATTETSTITESENIIETANIIETEKITETTPVPARVRVIDAPAVPADPYQSVANEQSRSIPLAPLVGFLGMSSALSAIVLWRLRKQRAVAHATRHVGQVPVTPTGAAAQVELAYRAIVTETHLGTFDDAAALAQQHCDRFDVAIQTVRVRNDLYCFSLTKPALAAAPFQQVASDEWHLSVGFATERTTTPAPFLISVGDTDDCSLWVSLESVEQFDVGATDQEIGSAVLSALTVQMLYTPWGVERTTIVVGGSADLEALVAGTHCQFVDDASMIDPAQWLTPHVNIVCFNKVAEPVRQIVEEHAGRITVFAVTDSLAASSFGLTVDCSSLEAVFHPSSVKWRTCEADGSGPYSGAVAISIVSLLGPAQFAAAKQLLSYSTTETITASTGVPSSDAWDQPAEPISTRAFCSTMDALTINIDTENNSVDNEPTVTVPVPTYEFTPAEMELPQDTPATVRKEVLSPEAIDQYLAQVFAPKVLELVVLAPRWSADIARAGELHSYARSEPDRSSAKVDELLMFLALNGPVGHHELSGSLFITRQVERSAIRQLVWRTRQFVGNVLVGSETTLALANGGYGLDWDRFVVLSRFGSNRCAAGDFNAAITVWTAAMNLIEGFAFQTGTTTGLRGGEGEWAIPLGLSQTMIGLITDTASQLADVALRCDRPEVAVWASEKARLVSSSMCIELGEKAYQGALRCDDLASASVLQASLERAYEDVELLALNTPVNKVRVS